MGTGTGKSLSWWRPTALYRLYDDQDVLLYIGIGFNPRTRWYHHKANKVWWPEVVRKEVQWYPDRDQAEAAERAAIRTEQPRYNIAGMIVPTVPTSPKPRRVRRVMDPVRAKALRKKSRGLRRAKATQERTRVALHEEILAAAGEGMSATEITRLIGNVYDVAHVSRLIRGKA